jgi:translocation and assembly module TamB
LSEHETMPLDSTEPPVQTRRGYWRHIVWTCTGLTVLIVMFLVGAYFWASSSAFENLVRGELIARIQAATGGRVEVASFHWHLLNLEAEANGVVIHGLEGPNEAPYAQVESIRAKISILGLWGPRVLLRSLEVVRPSLHIIVYEDGTSNQPRPPRPSKPGEPPLDRFFDLRAGHMAVTQGMLHYEDLAAAFDAQNRYIPLDFDVKDVSVTVTYNPAKGKDAESYRIELGARDLNLVRGSVGHPTAPPVQGFIEAKVDLTRNAAYLRWMRITARSKSVPDRDLDFSGSVVDFASPYWQANVIGELDMRLLESLTGYPNTPEGIARLTLAGQGVAGQFRIDGTVHAAGASYIQPGVNAKGVDFDAHLHADPEHLFITSVVAHLHTGGQVEGEVLLEHWLPQLPGTAVLQAPSQPPARSVATRTQEKSTAAPAPLHHAPLVLFTNGKVSAHLKNVTLDTVLDIVSADPFRRLGLDTLLNGPTTAEWTHGDVQTLSVNATLNMSPSGRPAANEAPVSGALDGTYFQRDGSVDLRRLQAVLPASTVEAHGRLGAYPLSSQSTLSLDFQSHNLGEFDTILRDLGLERNGTAGTAALPVSLAGQAEFHGMWTGSMVDPHIAGKLHATNLSVEMPPNPNDPSRAPQHVSWDSADATGSYSAARISIDNGKLVRGQASITVDGTLAAAATWSRGVATPAYDSDSLLHMHLRAEKINLADLLPLIGQKLPLIGTLNAQIDTEGLVHALNGDGWVELDNGALYGEPVARIRAQGKMANQVVQLASVTMNDAAGKVAASGTYDLASRRFQLQAQASGIDVAKIQSLRDAGITVTGSLGFSVTGGGTFDDPQLQGQANLGGLTLSGEPLGSVDFTAHTANHSLIYDVNSHLEATELTAHGLTALHGDNATQATVNISQLNIGAFLKMAHIPGLTGESALAGVITLEGPLARPEDLRGEARLQQLAVTVDGVHLSSEGGVHATLAGSRITLDPLHVTGEETDMRMHGTLSLKEKRQLDFGASGAINLKLAETLDSDLTASGNTTFQVEAHGPLEHPDFTGRIDFENAALALEDLPNSLSQLHGTLVFNQNRLEVKSLTAMSGGGLLSVSGYLAYQHGIYANLSVTGKAIRIRYPQGVSAAADLTLQLQGTQNNLLLDGNVLITRFTISPDLDFVALATQSSKIQPVAPTDSPSNHIRLDVRIQSSQQLNFQNAYAKLAGDVDLHVRGTLASPSLLGRISVVEGSATIAGTRYELQRGEITFTNPVRIQPLIDLNATARVEDYDITLGLHGTPDQMTVSYRSDPPLPEADVVALLALGRTQNQQRIYTQQQEQVTSNPTTDALLGGALNATVSSRVQKLFGAGSVKVDPNYLGVLGNSTTRITVEEQLGKNLTLTYATDVDTTGQQFLQAEIAINRHVSLLVARDESGIFSMVVKATRRFR